jgi:archaemetzincin
MTTSRRSLLKLMTCAPALAGAAVPADPIAIAAGKIKPLFKTKLPARAGDWLSEHKEAGQSYREFRGLTRTRAMDMYTTLRIVPIGLMTSGQATVLDAVSEFLRPFFGLTLEFDPPVRQATIPDNAQRVLYQNAPKQLLTTYVLNDVLMKRRRPKDAAVLGITGMDLWPGPGWNFVFGQASLTNRVGVWSMARNGNADDRVAMRQLCIIRTAQTATHETGHMFGIPHCTAYECGMNGSNHSGERDHQPLEFCPECQPKLWWSLGLDPLARSRALARVARKYGLEPLAGAFDKEAAALSRQLKSEREPHHEFAAARVTELLVDVLEIDAQRERLTHLTHQRDFPEVVPALHLVVALTGAIEQHAMIGLKFPATAPDAWCQVPAVGKIYLPTDSAERLCEPVVAVFVEDVRVNRIGSPDLDHQAERRAISDGGAELQ